MLRRGLDRIVARAEADARFRELLVADLEAAFAQEASSRTPPSSTRCGSGSHSPRIDAASGAEQESRDDPPVRPQRPRAAGRGRLHGADSRRRVDRRRDRSRRGRLVTMAARNSTDWDAAGGVAAQATTLRRRLEEALAPETRPTSTRWRRCAGRTSSRPGRATRRSEPARTGGRDPLAIAEVAANVAELAAVVAEEGDPRSRGDAAAAAMPRSAPRARAANLVEINLGVRELDERRLRANRFAADAAAARPDHGGRRPTSCSMPSRPRTRKRRNPGLEPAAGRRRANPGRGLAGPARSTGSGRSPARPGKACGSRSSTAASRSAIHSSARCRRIRGLSRRRRQRRDHRGRAGRPLRPRHGLRGNRALTAPDCESARRVSVCSVRDTPAADG